MPSALPSPPLWVSRPTPGEDFSPACDSTPAPGSEPLILVVEDDPALREGLCEFLKDDGFRAVGASNGLHALAQLESLGRPDLIILDLMMPVMNGWDFHARLKADPSLRSVPVLILSSYAKRESQAGPQDVDAALPKPVPMGDLLEFVRRLAVRMNH
jgi:two-component system, chemotaxis family, chemotaxis protein CheY